MRWPLGLRHSDLKEFKARSALHPGTSASGDAASAPISFRSEEEAQLRMGARQFNSPRERDDWLDAARRSANRAVRAQPWLDAARRSANRAAAARRGA